MENIIVYGAYLFGFIMVFVYSVKEFNIPEYRYDNNDESMAEQLTSKSKYARLAKPTLPKYMADTSRYNAFKWAFASFAILLYFLFSKLLLKVPGIDGLVGKESNEALVAIISLLIFLSIVKADDIKFSKIQFFIKWPKILIFGLIKDWMHSFAYIPGLGCDVFNVLCYKDIDIDSEEVKANIQKIVLKQYRNDIDSSKYIEINDFEHPGSPDNMTSRWTRLSYLIYVVNKWSTDPKFKNQVKERSLGWLSLREAYITLTESIAKFRNENEDMTQDEEEELSKHVDHLLASCYRLISCVVIMTARSTEDPLCYIHELGLKVTPGEQMFSRRGEIFRVVFAMVPVISVIAFSYTLLEPASDIDEMIKNIFIYIESAFVIMILPLILVRALKRQMIKSHAWKVVTPSDAYPSFFDMPLKIYTSISILSWGISLVFMMLLLSKNGLFASELAEWQTTAIFSFISAITAFITCYRTDIPPHIYSNRLTFLMGISKMPFIHGALTALTVWVGLHLSTSEQYTDYQNWQYPLLGFLISLVIGFMLFSGKHNVERRKISKRETCEEPVIIVQGEYQVPAMMINKDSNGVMLMLSQARTLLQANKTIEVILADGLKKMGSIVKIDLRRVNISYDN